MPNPSPFQVFISHDNKDYLLAYRVFNLLTRFNAVPYLYEHFPSYQEDIHTRIFTVLRNCRLCLCLLTNNGIESQWVHQELGAAYALGKAIIPCMEAGVTYKGFVQFRPRIEYNPSDYEQFAYYVLYAVRQEFLGHNRLPFTLTCLNDHKSTYSAPSTEDINQAIQKDRAQWQQGKRCAFFYDCGQCGIQIKVSPWTLEEQA